MALLNHAIVPGLEEVKDLEVRAKQVAYRVIPALLPS